MRSNAERWNEPPSSKHFGYEAANQACLYTKLLNMALDEEYAFKVR